MINSAALWPLLEPQWKDPKKWWKELATAKGRKDYDWAHLAMRYFPTRVDAKCQEDRLSSRRESGDDGLRAGRLPPAWEGSSALYAATGP